MSNDRIELPCKFGTLVCEVVRNDEDYRELAIDLHRTDGKVSQACVVGTDERAGGKDSSSVHIHLWDGDDADCCGEHHVDPFGDGWWGDDDAVHCWEREVPHPEGGDAR